MNQHPKYHWHWKRQPNIENLVETIESVWCGQTSKRMAEIQKTWKPNFLYDHINFSVAQLSIARMLHKDVCWFRWDIWVIQWRQPVKYLCDINIDPETVVPKIWSVGANPAWRQLSQRQWTGWQDKRQQLQWIMRVWAVQKKSKREKERLKFDKGEHIVNWE